MKIAVFLILIHVNHGHKYDDHKCNFHDIGNGICDLPCNNYKHRWDGGDCCHDTCNEKNPENPCGSDGYHCLRDEIPIWFYNKVQLCLRWSPTGDPAQCGGLDVPQQICAPPGEFTQPYYDDTTEPRKGGCDLSWGLHATDFNFYQSSWFEEIAICFRWFGSGYEHHHICGPNGVTPVTCAKLGNFTSVYRDNSMWGRQTACHYSWKLKLPENREPWAKHLMLCFKWQAASSAEQCNNATNSRMCALADKWTPYYRDVRDSRYQTPGGCYLQWGLFVK